MTFSRLSTLGLAALVGTWSAGAALAQDDAATEETPQIEAITMGEADAPLKVIEYASFTCPHCASFHDSVMPQLKENYIDTGEIEFEYREVFFDRYGLWAAMVARCAGSDERYFGISDLLYDQQREWTQGEPADIAQNLRRIGATAGLEPDTIEACLTDGATAEALVANFEANAEADGINSTPSFVIDGETYSNMSYEDFSALLDEKLADAEG